MTGFCPCMGLQTGVRVLAIIDAKLALWFIIICISVLNEVQKLDEERLALLQHSKTVLTSLAIFDMAVSITQLVMDILLCYGATQERWGICAMWLIMTGITLVKYIYNMVSNASSPGATQYAYVFYIAFVGYKFYELLVVFTFIQQLRGTRVQSGETADVNGPQNPVTVIATPGSQFRV